MISWREVEAWAREKDKKLRPADRPYLEFLAQHLNVPAVYRLDIPVHRLLPGPEGQKGRLAAFGELVKEAKTHREAPFVRLEGVQFHLRLTWLFCGDAAVYGETRWDPDTGIQKSLRGLEHSYQPAQLQQVLGLMKKVSTITQRGRPTGSGFYLSREEFETKAFPVMRALRMDSEHPTQDKLAEELGIEVSTLKRTLSRHGIVWQDFIRDVATLT